MQWCANVRDGDRHRGDARGGDAVPAGGGVRRRHRHPGPGLSLGRSFWTASNSQCACRPHFPRLLPTRCILCDFRFAHTLSIVFFLNCSKFVVPRGLIRPILSCQSIRPTRQPPSKAIPQSVISSNPGSAQYPDYHLDYGSASFLGTDQPPPEIRER